MNNAQIPWQSYYTPSGIEMFSGATPNGTYTLNQNQLNAYQTSGALYNSAASVRTRFVYDPRVVFQPPGSSGQPNYNFHDPVYVAWSDPTTYNNQQARRAYLEENVAAWVENNPAYGYYSKWNTNAALIR